MIIISIVYHILCYNQIFAHSSEAHLAFVVSKMKVKKSTFSCNEHERGFEPTQTS